jgi:hypothetical protein
MGKYLRVLGDRTTMPAWVETLASTNVSCSYVGTVYCSLIIGYERRFVVPLTLPVASSLGERTLGCSVWLCELQQRASKQHHRIALTLVRVVKTRKNAATVSHPTLYPSPSRNSDAVSVDARRSPKEAHDAKVTHCVDRGRDDDPATPQRYHASRRVCQRRIVAGDGDHWRARRSGAALGGLDRQRSKRPHALHAAALLWRDRPFCLRAVWPVYSGPAGNSASRDHIC